MKEYIQTVLHPERSHEGWLKPPYFEGWYFKVVDAAAENAWAFIVGVFRQRELDKSEAFIQVLDGNSGDVHVFSFPYAEFISNQDSMDIRIGENRFNLEGIYVNLHDADFRLQGELAFGEAKGWPVSLHSPGIMGPFGWFNWLECYHGVLSFDHKVSGTLAVNDRHIILDGGRGYIEKDFGKTFPYAWIWLQTNNFEEVGTSLSASIAVVPFMGLRLKGLIVGLQYKGKLHAFTTYNGARIISFKVVDNRLSIIVSRGSWKLQIEAERTGGGVLKAPEHSGMDRRITESLNAWAKVSLWRRGELIFEDTGRRAGMEIVGEMEALGARSV